MASHIFSGYQQNCGFHYLHAMRCGSVVILLIGCLWGCRQDFDITAPYRELPVVYGLIDIQDSIHYLRIQRAFVDSSLSALTIATRPDSLYYPDILDVTVANDCTGQSWLLERISGDQIGLPKEEGLFASGTHVLYRFAAQLEPGHHLRLHLLNRQTGHEATSSTGLVGPFNTIVPAPGYVVSWGGGQDEFVNLAWKPAAHALVYEMVFSFHWYDVPNSGTDTVPQVLSFTIFGNMVTAPPASELNLTQPYPTMALYQQIGSMIHEDSTLHRIPRFVRWRITAGGTALGLLVGNQQVQQGITAGQNLTVYTNIDNGLGIFSSRYTMEFDNALGSNAMDSLRHGRFTRHLRFR